MKVLTLQQVTDRTTLSRATIYRMIEAGEIGLEDTFMVDFKRKKRVITESWVEQFLKEQQRLCL